MQPTILEETQKWNKSNVRTKSIASLMGKWIVASNLLPYCVVDTGSFKKMAIEMQLYYDIPSQYIY